VGYRHYDAHGIQPLFAFGHGLSYTSFDYENLVITPNDDQTINVDFDLTNTGDRSGAEIAQLYIGIPATDDVPQPPKQLKGFQKVQLDAGATGHVHFVLDQRALSYWDTTSHAWTVAAGTYQIMVGSSSRDIRLTGATIQP
ncbi:MAG: fibronectin type III-like domain-contianing protein, partial [Acidobacteriaceae bacterium]|nr:fibronectin type III-like domain-contianing protein [Acidobacteriaceae bacterium]